MAFGLLSDNKSWDGMMVQVADDGNRLGNGICPESKSSDSLGVEVFNALENQAADQVCPLRIQCHFR